MFKSMPAEIATGRGGEKAVFPREFSCFSRRRPPFTPRRDVAAYSPNSYPRPLVNPAFGIIKITTRVVVLASCLLRGALRGGSLRLPSFAAPVYSGSWKLPARGGSLRLPSFAPPVDSGSWKLPVRPKSERRPSCGGGICGKSRRLFRRLRLSCTAVTRPGPRGAETGTRWMRDGFSTPLQTACSNRPSGGGSALRERIGV